MTVPFASHQLEGRRSSTVIGILIILREAVLACVLHSSQPAGTGFGGRVLAVSSVTAVMGLRELWGDVLGHSL